MSQMVPGTELDLLTGLGNGYDLEKSGDKPLLIGGGVGIPPLYALAKKLIAQGKSPRAILGFNRKEEQFLTAEFRALGIAVLSVYLWACAHASGHRRKGCDLGTIQL